MSAAPLPADLPPELAHHPRYKILKELGRGGMGVVYQAEQTLMGRTVAVKVINKAVLDHPDALERFRREIRVVARLSHPNIVLAHDAEQVGNLHLLVMEYVEGQDLDRLLDRQGPLPVTQACDYVRQAALGLQHACERGLVHRDLKPRNLMLTPGGQVKILDFGLAKVVRESGVDQALTSTNACMGTAEYCAPEQAADARAADTRADIYSLGCTLFALVAGRPPFREGTAILTFLAHLTKVPPPLLEVRPDAPPELGAVVARLLAKDPAQRPQTPAEVAQILAPFCMDGEGHAIRPPTPGPTTRIPIWEVPQPVRVVRPSPLDCTGAVGLTAAEVREAQEAWARYLGRSVEETVEIADGVQMTFVLVPPGKFRMGSPEGEKDRGNDEALHVVTLTEPFDIAKTQLTQAQYEALTGDSPSHFEGADLPVENVSWEDAHDYAVKLTKKKSDKRLYRLPTDAEWEYACRGGRPSSRPFGVGGGRALSSREANFDGNHPYGGADMGPYLNSTCRVGSYPANALGLYDMHGTVWEWCADWYGPYPQEDATNPSGPPGGSSRVLRGGGWGNVAGNCRAARRHRGGPGVRDFYLGFRLARSVPSGGK